MLSQRYEEQNKFSQQEEAESHTDLIKRVRKALEIDLSSDERFAASMPFSDNDATCGCENEFQAVVMGNSCDVDLPITIRDSSCYKNILKRNKRDGENYRKVIGFERYLKQSDENSAGELLSDDEKSSRSEQKEFEDVWENSWVRFPKERLNLYATHILDRDLYFDKQNPSLGYRKDINSFFVKKDGVEYLRIPVSYLLKIALANAVGNPSANSALRATAKNMMSCYINDNSSPEILSFFPSPLKIAAGREISAVRETAIRFLLIQLLTAYANRQFRLIENGQRAMVYFASHTPQRQKQFNTTIPDAFYRELFMSPCLSGWDQGEYKMGYMHICHRVLSRSRLNAVSKLKMLVLSLQILLCFLIFQMSALPTTAHI
ncbi:MAG: hypothetical protein HQK74_02620 [Desulfamplus sp.]|nr:hypothetical protein [Desulfamplus sp.]